MPEIHDHETIEARLVLHDLDDGRRCLRCGGDFAWLQRVPAGPVCIGLRRADGAPLWMVPIATRSFVAPCEPDADPWPPEIVMLTKRNRSGDSVVVGYKRK